MFVVVYVDIFGKRNTHKSLISIKQQTTLGNVGSKIAQKNHNKRRRRGCNNLEPELTLHLLRLFCWVLPYRRLPTFAAGALLLDRISACCWLFVFFRQKSTKKGGHSCQLFVPIVCANCFEQKQLARKMVPIVFQLFFNKNNWHEKWCHLFCECFLRKKPLKQF